VVETLVGSVATGKNGTDEEKQTNKIYLMSQIHGVSGIVNQLKSCSGGDEIRHPSYPELKIFIRKPFWGREDMVFDVFRDGRNQGPNSQDAKAAAEIFIRLSPINY